MVKEKKTQVTGDSDGKIMVFCQRKTVPCHVWIPCRKASDFFPKSLGGALSTKWQSAGHPYWPVPQLKAKLGSLFCWKGPIWTQQSLGIIDHWTIVDKIEPRMVAGTDFDIWDVNTHPWSQLAAPPVYLWEKAVPICDCRVGSLVLLLTSPCAMVKAVHKRL